MRDGIPHQPQHLQLLQLENTETSRMKMPMNPSTNSSQLTAPDLSISFFKGAALRVSEAATLRKSSLCCPTNEGCPSGDIFLETSHKLTIAPNTFPCRVSKTFKSFVLLPTEAFTHNRSGMWTLFSNSFISSHAQTIAGHASSQLTGERIAREGSLLLFMECLRRAHGYVPPPPNME